MVGLLEGTAGRHPGRPFPLTGTWLWGEDAGPYEDPDAVIEQVARHGSIMLGTDGCGMDWHLIVTGPHRGHLWQITGEEGFRSGPRSATPPPSPASPAGCGTGRTAGSGSTPRPHNVAETSDV